MRVDGEMLLGFLVWRQRFCFELRVTRLYSGGCCCLKVCVKSVVCVDGGRMAYQVLEFRSTRSVGHRSIVIYQVYQFINFVNGMQVPPPFVDLIAAFQCRCRSYDAGWKCYIHE